MDWNKGTFVLFLLVKIESRDDDLFKVISRAQPPESVIPETILRLILFIPDFLRREGCEAKSKNV